MVDLLLWLSCFI